VALPTLSAKKIYLSRLSSTIEKEWVGHEHNSDLLAKGSIYLDQTQGIIKLCRDPPRGSEIFRLEDIDRGVKICVMPKFPSDPTDKFDSGDHKVVFWLCGNDNFLKTSEKDFYKAAAKFVIENNKEHWLREIKYLNEKSWLQIIGMTPRDAVAKLRQLGW
jgi:hypothetical protein